MKRELEDMMKLTRRGFSRVLAASLAAPAFIGRAGAQGATLKIGMCAPVTGPAAEQGRYAQTGAKIALDAVNKAGGVLGKQVELIIEDVPDDIAVSGELAQKAFVGRCRHREIVPAE